MTSIRLLFVLYLLIGSVKAVSLPEGSGIMYDANYSFFLTAPQKWVLDSSVAKSSGVCAVFYPIGSSWKDSAVVFYVNTREKNSKTLDAADAVTVDIEEMHKNGSPQAKAEKIKEMKLKKDRIASIWQYTGDQWGNYERTAFIVEEKGISAIVMSARSKKDMEDANAAFEDLVKSYDYLGKVVIKK